MSKLPQNRHKIHTTQSGRSILNSRNYDHTDNDPILVGIVSTHSVFPARSNLFHMDLISFQYTLDLSLSSARAQQQLFYVSLLSNCSLFPSISKCPSFAETNAVVFSYEFFLYDDFSAL